MNLKLIVISTVLMTLSVITYGQKAYFKGGINIATINYSSDGVSATPADLVGFHIGASYEVRLGENVVFLGEGLFSKQGDKVDTPAGQIQEQLYYLIVPLLLKYQPTAAFGVYTGIQPGQLLFSNSVNGTNISNGLKKFDLAIPVGLEVNIIENLKIGGRYNFGFVNILKFSGAKAQNRVFQIYLAAAF